MLLIKFEFIYKLNLIKHVINKIKVIFGIDCVFCFLRVNGGKGGFFFFFFPFLGFDVTGAGNRWLVQDNGKCNLVRRPQHKLVQVKFNVGFLVFFEFDLLLDYPNLCSHGPHDHSCL
jgi:hypothetical protein